MRCKETGDTETEGERDERKGWRERQKERKRDRQKKIERNKSKRDGDAERRSEK